MTYALPAAMVAAAACSTAQSFDGAYAGAHLGHNGTNIEVTETWTPSSYDGFSASGLEYGPFAGYGQTLKGGIYLGTEAEASLSSAENKISSPPDTLTTEKKHSYGASARAGYDMGAVMPYVRIGINRAKFKQTLTGTLSGSANESKSGIAYGAGIEAKLTDSMSLRGEFVQTSYGKISDTHGTDTITYKPKENVARVGLAVRS